MIKREDEIQRQIVQYLEIAYPKALFKCDTNTGAFFNGSLKQRVIQGRKMKTLGNKRGFPDIYIFECKKGYYGLFIELKADGVKIFTKDGRPATKHIAEQNQILEQLKARNYYATFSNGFMNTKKIIDWYLKE